MLGSSSTTRIVALRLPVSVQIASIGTHALTPLAGDGLRFRTWASQNFIRPRRAIIPPLICFIILRAWTYCFRS